VPNAFLTAEWQNLVMMNFRVDPGILEPLVPAGVTLDTWKGIAFVSLVGFVFANTRVLGLAIPGHRTFDEVNLRFYVRRSVDGEVRRGVTFLREFVPRIAIATTARLLYNEPYRAVPMRHTVGSLRSDGVPQQLQYRWHAGGRWAAITALPQGDGGEAAAGSEEEFITEHYWGYTRQRDGGTVEYQVAHPKWRVWSCATMPLAGELAKMYGPVLGAVLSGAPSSTFFADGSAVTVYAPRRLPRASIRQSRQVAR
jgi:uncharacterized protein YqjF (DUF2071 family)